MEHQPAGYQFHMKTFISHFCTGLVIGCLLVCAPVQAQEPRIGFVKTDRIFKEANIAKTAQAKIEHEFSTRDKDLVEKGALLKSSVEKFQVEAPALSAVQRASHQKLLEDQDREYQRKRREFQEDLNTRRNEEMQHVLAKANEVVKQVADAEKYDLVLQDAVYVNPRLDLTDKVLNSLNAQPVK